MISDYYAMLDQIKEQISSLYKYEDLRDMYIKYGIKSSLSDIEVSDDKIFDLLKYAPMVRNRLTLLRLLSSGSIKL